MLTALGTVIEQATAAFDEFNHARALEVTEAFFWTFCDDYLELVKERAYTEDINDPARVSAVVAMRRAVDVMLRLFAPFIPFATEETWSWTHESSVHLASWPVPADALAAEAGDTRLLELTSQALTSIRGAKTDAKASQKTPVLRATIAAPAEDVALLEQVQGDLASVGRIESLSFEAADELSVRDIELGELPPKQA